MGSVSIEQMERRTVQEMVQRKGETCNVSLACMRFYRTSCRHPPFDTVNAGLHWSLRMSRQMEPFELMLGW